MKVVYLLLTFFLMSCTESGNGTLYRLAEDTRDRTGEALTGVEGKSLFSLWRNTAHFATSLDLTGQDFQRSFTQGIKIDTLVTCDCFVYIDGNESTGSMRISHCFDRAGNHERFNCESLEGLISYSKSASDLKLFCVNKPICGVYR